MKNRGQRIPIPHILFSDEIISRRILPHQPVRPISPSAMPATLKSAAAIEIHRLAQIKSDFLNFRWTSFDLHRDAYGDNIACRTKDIILYTL